MCQNQAHADTPKEYSWSYWSDRPAQRHVAKDHERDSDVQAVQGRRPKHERRRAQLCLSGISVRRQVLHDAPKPEGLHADKTCREGQGPDECSAKGVLTLSPHRRDGTPQGGTCAN